MSRKRLIAFLSLVILTYIGLFFRQAIAHQLTFFIVLALFCCIAAYKYPKAALWGFLAYMPFNGTVVYWVAGGNALFQLLPDFLYFPALIALVQTHHRQKLSIKISPKLLIAFGILLTFTLMTLFFVNGGLQLQPECSALPTWDRSSGCKNGIPFAQGILGLKVFVGYVPLLFCAYSLIRNKQELLWFTRLQVILALICCGLCLIQYQLLRSGICLGTEGLGAVGDDLFKASLDAKCLVGGALAYSPSRGEIRLPGTFVSPWHWEWFLISSAFFTSVSMFCDRAPSWRILSIVGIGVVFICSFISGQPIALLFVPLITLISLLLIIAKKTIKSKTIIFILVGLGTISLVVSSNHAKITTLDFIVEQFRWVAAQNLGLLGKGLGFATNSTRIFGRAALIEAYHPKLLYEIGYLGFVAFLIFATLLVLITFQTVRSLKDRHLSIYGIYFWLFIVIVSFWPYWYPLDTNPVNIYYWFVVGILLKLPKLEKQQEMKKE